ncbi:carbohydrate-binding domain-containing protein [Paenibacillus crassostreae]|uniref:Dockerin type 1 n=1 Tax=Paenibacillus crassostreae TaxID=1763538 RepID=A0A167BBB6_9BACL|nr:carbohydrate-binding domain-containing protein [Paenibacillus crassostreae]AOZ92999.1 dockerin type 1 [Paenibacillus crassostreae]OAB71912.1 dockerin type 1 [Paenibacillus crassostreae]
MKDLLMGSKVGLVLLCAVLMSACSTTSTTTTAVEDTATISTVQSGTDSGAELELASINISDLVTFDEEDSTKEWSTDNSTAIELSGNNATISGAGAEAVDGSVKITAAGTYVLSGTLDDGQIVVNVQDKGTVQLVLNGVNLHDSDSAPIYIVEAGKVVMTLQEGTENVVTDGETYVYEDASTDEPNAAIFSKADLTINGTGKLSVTANYNNGITSKDDLKIMGGTIEIQAADDGMMGKDMVAIQDGEITITASGDGIKATNDEDATKGFIAITAGSFDIQADNDGIQAETALLIDGGTYNLVTGGGNANGEVKTESMGQGPGGRGGFEPGSEVDPTATTIEPSTETTTETSTETESTSAKGLKAGGDMTVNNGTFKIDSADDAIHGNSNVAINGGDIGITSGDDGIHADALVSIAAGSIDISKSYEGIEGANITISDGEIHIVASDDGVNVAGGNDGSSVNGCQGQNEFSTSENNLLTINGGYITVDATGDGLDANGSVTMSGGTVIVNGPTNSGNGTLDYDGSFELTGGTLVAAGSSGMSQGPSDESSQYSVVMNFTETQQAGTMVQLEDSEGNNVVTFAPSKDYQTVVISSPDLVTGGSYTLYSGGTSTGSVVDGLYTDGEYEGGTEIVTFDISSSVTWLNESGVTTGNTNQGPGGGMRGTGGMGGTKPEGGKGE